MNGYLFFALISIYSVPALGQAGKDFWRDCPGPACPADRPEKTYEKAREERVYDKMPRNGSASDGVRESREARPPVETERERNRDRQ